MVDRESKQWLSLSINATDVCRNQTFSDLPFSKAKTSHKFWFMFRFALHMKMITRCAMWQMRMVSAQRAIKIINIKLLGWSFGSLYLVAVYVSNGFRAKCILYNLCIIHFTCFECFMIYGLMSCSRTVSVTHTHSFCTICLHMCVSPPSF